MGQPLVGDNGVVMGVALSVAAQARVAGERPNQRWSRLAPKSAFPGRVVRMPLEGAHGFWAAQKVHVNLSDLAVAELHVASASPLVSLRRRPSAELCDDRGRDDARRAFGEDTRLGRAHPVHVA